MYECTGNAPSDWILTKIATVYPAINCVFFFFFFFGCDLRFTASLSRHCKRILRP